jgi:asparagine N-glycosylation enzyme membrane subunit Stt3
MEEDNLLQERKQKLVGWFKRNYSLLSYAILGIIVFLTYKIRTSNLPGLRDITTGNWTLGPDLDPFLFMRWAKYIVQHGSIMAVDTLRSVPIGFPTDGELLFHPYLMAWFHKIYSIFGSTSVEQSSALFPAVMFALTVVAFFLFVRRVFVRKIGLKNANIVALVSSFFLSVVPVILPRTIAGIPEKESSAFLFMFLAFYFFLVAWDSAKSLKKYSFAALSGISTALMALIWGGYVFIFVTLALTILIAFLLGQVDRSKFYIYSIWILTSSIIMNLFSARYGIITLASSTTTGIAFAVFLILLVDNFISSRVRKYIKSEKILSLPRPVFSLILAVLLGLILATLLFGPSFVFDKAVSVKNTLVTPTTDRLGVTVAENRQPFFTEWAGSFGPTVKGTPLFFWLFFIGSIYLFNEMFFSFTKKERVFLVSSYTIFLFALIFSRYDPNSTLNGTNFQSLFLYALGFIVLISSFAHYYFKFHKTNQEEKLKSIDTSLILVFSLFFLSLVSVRGAVRLIMVLVPSASIITSFFVVSLFNSAMKKEKKDNLRVVHLVLAGIVIFSAIFAGTQFYKESSAIGSGYIPSIYNQQWQKAMSWVRTSTSENAVFGHWWDYGYWVQSIGERATVLDGGNVIPYWNHLMGRYALTGTDSFTAAEFLYAHQTTHFLIDSSDVGKYAAFSSIGSDENYDRRSWLQIFHRDNANTLEGKNSTTFVYQGGIPLDGDIIYEQDGNRIFLPGDKAGILGVTVQRDSLGNMIGQPEAVFVYQGAQQRLPLRYAFDKEFIDFGSGVPAGVYFIPRVSQNSIEENGVLIYLSPRTVKSQLARLYLYKENDPYFKLVHSEDDYIVSQVKTQYDLTSDIVYYGGLRGPIRIWELNYPSGMSVKEEYLRTNFQNKVLESA